MHVQLAGDKQQINNKNETLISTPIGIDIADTILNEGDNVTLELIGHVGVTPTWVCYRSNVTQISSAPQCADYGSAMSIKSIGSGSNVVCTEPRNDGSSFGIKWSESNQSNIWARACTRDGDAQQQNNENVELKLSILTNINISLSDYRAGQSNVIMTISFDTTDHIPMEGVIELTYPSQFLFQSGNTQGKFLAGYVGNSSSLNIEE